MGVALAGPGDQDGVSLFIHEHEREGAFTRGERGDRLVAQIAVLVLEPAPVQLEHQPVNKTHRQCNCPYEN